LSATVSSNARAQSWGARLVRALDKVGRTDLVADANGKIPVSVTLPPGAALPPGLAPFDVDTASMRLLPAQVIALGEQHPEIEITVGPGLRPLLDVSKAWTRADKYRAATGFDGTGVAVGIIDTGIDILHPDFRNADGTTRIKWLMQTDLASGMQPEMEKKYCTDFGLTCAIFSEADINALIDKKLSGGTFDPTGHGTHVTSIAAGNGGPQKKYVGVAPGADILFAGLASFRDDAVSVAAQFIFDRAAEAQQPCAVNLSLGSDYGAHDGSDILDRRLSRLVGDDKPGRAIVVAAGNSGSLFQVGDDTEHLWGIHTEAKVYAHSEVRIPIYAPESETGRGFLWATFSPDDDISIALEGPGGTWVGPVGPGSEGSFEDGPNTAAIVNNKFKAGASLVPVTNGAVAVWSGKWEENSEFVVRLSGHGTAQLWLTSTGDLALSSGLLFKRAKRQGTINVPAAAPSLLAVGCTVNRLAWPTVNGPDSPVALTFFGGDEDPKVDSLCYFSSSGPTPGGLPKPELVAPGAFVSGAMASSADPRNVPGGLFDVPGCPPEIPNCYLTDERHAITAGTSMSSPQVAGAIALLFQADPTLTQARVTSVLQAGARYPKGKVPNDVQLGPGALDLMGALQALGAEKDGFADPDPAKSWYVLSSEHARPDPTWPVWGTVELRRANGDVAHALDGTFLTLDVQNGTVLQPLRKIRHGLWRFAVAGEEGKSGQEMKVEVRYAGTSLGARTLPIGNDVWSGTEPLASTGGCSMGPPASDPSRAPVWAFALVATAFGVSSRRRRARR
ncbi:MAG: S8 family serine peptidase, partial [Polyangiaceae bacterium]